MRLWKKKNSSRDYTLTPDEIFLDSENIPGFSRERFEGVLERPISRAAVYSFGVLLFLFGAGLVGRTFWLQTVRGDELLNRAENNYIEKKYITPPRGVIIDRAGKLIVTNTAETKADGLIEYVRTAKNPYAFSHLVGILGSVKNAESPSSTAPGIVLEGKSGLEAQYDTLLRGVSGERNAELDARGKVLAEGLIRKPKEGDTIKTTIDADLQEALWQAMDKTANERGFRGGVGLIFSIKDGAIYAMTSVPSFDINAFYSGLDNESAKTLFSDSRAPLFNRAVSGTFAPGSIMKPFIALAALEEHIITPEKQIFSSGSLSLPDPYQKGKQSVFLDWKAHGFVDMRKAIAVSSDVYFYTVGGGFGDVKGLGIEKIKYWLSKFGFEQETNVALPGEKSGFLPDPETKKTSHPENPIWRIGDTYHASIGQGDVLVTPLEVMRGLGILANDGRAFTPYVVTGQAKPLTDAVMLDASYYQVIREGMKRSASSEGTAAAVSWVPFGVAAKTGTAEIGNKDRVNSWFMGYAPYDNPQFGMVILMESGPRANLVGASSIASDMFRWIIDHGGPERFMN